MTARGYHRGFGITTQILKGVRVPYKYTVGGREYSSERTLLAEVGSREQAVELLEKYPPGKKAAVHYNPEDPRQAVLEPVFFWSHYVHSVLPAAGLLALLVAFEVNLTWALAVLAGAIWVFWSAVAWRDTEISFAGAGVRSPQLRSQLDALPQTNWDFNGAVLLSFSFFLSAVTLLMYVTAKYFEQLLSRTGLPGSILFVLLAGFVLVGLGLLALRRRYLPEQQRRHFGLNFLAGPAFVVAIFIAWSYAAANMHYDTGPAKILTGVVVDKWEDERGNILWVRFHDVTLLRVKVSPADYEHARKGAAVHLKIRPGYFDLPWVAGYELEPAARTD